MGGGGGAGSATLDGITSRVEPPDPSYVGHCLEWSQDDVAK